MSLKWFENTFNAKLIFSYLFPYSWAFRMFPMFLNNYIMLIEISLNIYLCTHFWSRNINWNHVVLGNLSCPNQQLLLSYLRLLNISFVLNAYQCDKYWRASWKSKLLLPLILPSPWMYWIYTDNDDSFSYPWKDVVVSVIQVAWEK